MPPYQIVNLVRPAKIVQAETDYRKGMATFVHGLGGLMYEASIGGQKFTFEPLLFLGSEKIILRSDKLACSVGIRAGDAGPYKKSFGIQFAENCPQVLANSPAIPSQIREICSFF